MNQPVYVVVNPEKGRFKEEDGQSKAWAGEISRLIEMHEIVRPTFVAGGSTTITSLRAFLKTWNASKIGIVLRNSAISPAEIATLVDGVASDCLYFLLGEMPSSCDLKILSEERCVPVGENFRTQARNAFYAGIEPFTDMHKRYRTLGFAGFGDFTTLSGSYREMGAIPRAIAIHLTFANRVTHEIFVEHFVSNIDDSENSNLTEKMRQAIDRVAEGGRRLQNSIAQTAAYDKYLAASAAKSAVSLATNKRWSISHHLDFISGFMAGRYI